MDDDPYRPDATVEERTDHVIGVLLMDEDPVRRYHTIKALQDGRLRDVTAICLRQLRDALGSTDAAADALGISRQAANELLAKAGAPGAREDRAVADKPTYWYGEYLAATRAVADAIQDEKAREKALDWWQNKEPKVTQSLLVLPAVAEMAQRWLKTIRGRQHRPNWATGLANTLDERGARIADWVNGRTDPRLSVQEQSEVYIGYHAARVAARKEREARRAEAE